MKDFMYAAVDKDTWREVAIAQGIAHAEIDPESGLLELVYNEGFHADHIGAIPPDTRFHVNLRVLAEDAEIEREFIRSKRYKPKSETGVGWVDPETVNSPSRVWFGGMDYFAENIPDVLPQNLVLPTLDHLTARPGDLVSVSPGTWAGEPDLITYQWMRDGVPINQAITPYHTARLADVNHTLTCIETAKNSAGETSVSTNGCPVS
jgi:hypothetical protein